MTGKACAAFIIIASDTQVLISCFLIGMTCCTSKYRVVVGVGMTFGTLIPYTFMGSAIDREVLHIMIAVFSTRPVCFCMTGCTLS